MAPKPSNSMAQDATRALERILAGANADEVEGPELEFKQESDRIRDTERILAEAALCFANAQGGTIVVGVHDRRRGREALIGCSLDPVEVQARIYQLTTPALLVAADAIDFDGCRLIVLRVPRSPEIHSDRQGRARRRIGASCQTLTPPEQAILREDRRGTDWSALRSSHGGAALDRVALASARERLARGDRESRPAPSLSDEDLTRLLGVVDGDGHLTRAGEVLLCSSPLNEEQVIYQYKPTPGGEPSLVERLGGPLLVVLGRLTDLIWARRNTTPVNLPDGTQIEVADFPEGAVREAIVNALLHREFRFRSPIYVEHSPSTFVVQSPGPLVAGITVSNILTHPSKPRNPCLFAAARRLRIAEETGRGVDRMFRDLLRAGYGVPEFSQSVDSTRVTLVSGAPRTQVVRFVEQLPSQERDDVDTLLTLFTMLSSQEITAEQLAPIVQKSPSEARAVLRRLSDDPPAILEATRDSARMKSPRYRLRSAALGALGRAVAYHRPGLDDLDRKVIAHLEEYGHITNKTVQNLLDVDMIRARDLIRGMRDRGLLVKVSKHQRGPGVRYGAGPKYPGPSAGEPGERSDEGPEGLFD